MENLEELAQQMRRYIDDPVAFVVNVLHAQPDKWQEEALQAIGKNPRVSAPGTALERQLSRHGA